MKEIICYQHYIRDLIFLVPVPQLTEDQKLENVSAYGTPYGEHRQPYMEQGGLAILIDVTTQTMVFASSQERLELA